ncbi:hypothetical protein EMIHUDRAFT_249796 [Emiliania huxleyi CCMP1516]|uniref:Fe2OG dioxygenase domain-containing protein n=2 Tax=Emiliania huxleyi TaxID=2903 RepID=A0A0D3I5V7_EMIH1|nr:hypothetical protein EMIHUDRAFT_249796 [Emiliania huxleyi CCMP1516]EOD06642.1 hypothetical protein EMIHUDRAFT_249796 [Emiliania huxleyi CCMP1516]|eukprot:XP_005759071.1 hypothetical protein EMIHUDRAFT_249796 [Emiliania huxleyi CCMP1516]
MMVPQSCLMWDGKEGWESVYRSVPDLVVATCTAALAAEIAPPSLKALYTRFPDNAADLLRDGALLVQLLNPAEVSTVLHQLSTQKTDKKAPRRLDHSQGNGYAGEYADLTKPLPDLLQRCQDAARKWLIDHAGPLCEVKRKETRGGTDVTVTMSGKDALDKSKALLLRYGLGGINFAHRDSCGDFQALLLLSQPGVDYTGGEFYLADANPPFETQPFPFAAAGELLLFRGRQGHGAVEWKHGMQEVKAGSAKVTRRVAVGFFQ